MGFAITSAVFGGVVIICYSLSVAIYSHERRWYWESHHSEMAVTAIILILGIVEFAIGIWASVLCCLIVNCCSSTSTQVKWISVCHLLFINSGQFLFLLWSDSRRAYKHINCRNDWEVLYRGNSREWNPWDAKKVPITGAGCFRKCKNTEFCGSWEKRGFVKVAICRAACPPTRVSIMRASTV